MKITEKEKQIKAVETKVSEKCEIANTVVIDHFLELNKKSLLFSCANSENNMKLNLKPRRNTRKRFVMTMKL